MSSDSAAATTAAQGDIADPAKIKADNAAAAEANGSNGDAKTNGDSATNGTSPSKAAASTTGEPPVAGPSKSPTKKEVDVVKQAMGYLTAGKRDLLIRDPASAVASLAQACQLLGDHYGETAPECGEPYYYYGRALLDLARMEAGVIDNVLDGVPDEDDSADDSMVGDPEKCTDEEKERVGKDVDEALKENYESCEKAKAEKEAKEAAAATNGDEKEANGEGQSQTDGNCVAKPSEAKASPKDKATNGSPKDKATNGSPKDKAANGKDSPKDKAANGKVSPKDKASNGKDSPKDKASPKEKEANGSPKESKTSPAAKDVKTSPKDKASPAAKDSSKASPGAKESKSSPASKEPKSSPSGAAKESKSSPATKDAKKSEDAEMTSPEVKKGGPTGEVNVSEDMELEVVSKNGVNGHATDKPKKESEEDSKDGDDEEEEGGEESQEDDKDEGGEDKENEETEEDEKDDSIQGDEAEKGDVAATEKEDEDEPSNLQLAWEMLELAKNILVKQSESLEKAEGAAKEADKERKDKVNSRICDTFQTLGELSIENENYPQAIEDLGTCLQRRKEMLPEDSRLIAETHYQLGVAQGFNLDFDRAVDSLNEAIAVLAKRVDNLKAKTESVDPAKKADAFYTREAEVKEIESLIPEIKEKIADTNDMKAETQKKLAETRLSLGLAAGAETEVAASAGGASSSGLGKSADTSKVSTISTSLIKKRKKSGEENGAAGDAESEPTSAKKPLLEAAAAESTKDSAASKQ